MAAQPKNARASIQRLLQALERRLPALTRYRQPEPLPIALHARRVYVLPTRFGLLYAGMLLVMLLGALNFNNNAALLLTFALIGVALLSLPHTVHHLSRVTLHHVHAQPVRAGQPLSLQWSFAAQDGRRHADLCLRCGAEMRVFDLSEPTCAVYLPQPTVKRGWQEVGRCTLSTQAPFGLFRAWSVVHPQQRVLVYPRPDPLASALPTAAQTTQAANAELGDEWRGVRDYRSGDAKKQIAWKASARHGQLLVSESAHSQPQPILRLDYHALAPLEHEARIARLARWVLEASARNLRFTLVLPQATLGPDRGESHRERCLTELALLP